ncbi:hypothetical protein K490DRAFT_47825 [Saccharata proteae CBS 121410]|uniref:Uncharacterized protein n=1 Tax=Saccharata proteae CBS 121410 TaxID=1314787 RepID=A0A9P4HTE8_9PEZI|nr:hypothetical protein K490DRAFT_47825 [Saccharata proteae CBS 121410]
MASRGFASGDYGSGKGDPVGENPQDQGPSKSSDLEHPGPPPPSAGQGTGTTPTKGTADGHNTGSSKSEGSGHGNKSQQVKGAQPKILNANPPKEESEEVAQHNREMEQRAERADTKISNEDAEKDKVPKGFWSGMLIFEGKWGL